MRLPAFTAAAFTLATPIFAQSTANPPGATDFGAGLAIVDGRILVGRGGGETGSIYPSAGGVHVYERHGGGWTEVGRFAPGEVAVGDRFGTSIAALDDLVLVGAPGRSGNRGTAYVFAGPAGSWRELAQLGGDNAAGERMGTAVALGNDLAVLGAPGEQARGAAYVFRRTGGGWALEGRLTGGSGAVDGFGTSVALAADRLAIGAPGEDGGRGAVYLFSRRASGWARDTTIRRANGSTGDRFGEAVAAGLDVVFVGSPGAAQSRGAVMAIAHRRGAWETAAEVASPDTSRGTRFGSHLAVAAGQVWIGAPGTDRNRGAAWVVPAASPATLPPRRIDAGTLKIGDRLGDRIVVDGSVAALAATGADARTGAVVVLEGDGASWRRGTVLHEPPPGTLAAMTGDEARCADGKVGQFACSDVDLVAFLPLEALGGRPGVIANDIWGWTDPETKREYALVGRSDGTAFVDITNPGQPVYLGELPLHEGANENLWRDIKVYRDHAFIVADGAGQHGVQVFDLTRLRNPGPMPARFTETAHYDRIASAHNIVINEETGFAFSVGSSGGGETCGGGLHMIDVRVPTRPTFAGCFAHPNTGRSGTGYSHDAQCVVYRGPDARYRDREICLGANETALSIADITDKANPVTVASAAYPNVAYAHQGWLSEDHRYFFMGDEADEVTAGGGATRTLVWDLSELDDPVLLTEYRAKTRAIDHNQYVKGKYLYQSNLLAGLRVLDVSDPANPREVGFFDTVPWDDDQTGFGGSWSNYPYFASGVIAVSSWSEGLFLVKRRERPVP